MRVVLDCSKQVATRESKNKLQPDGEVKIDKRVELQARLRCDSLAQKGFEAS